MLSPITQYVNASSMETFISDLRPRLSEPARILTPSDPEFSAANERWTDIDRKTPAVIVQPACENDMVKLVGQPPSPEFDTTQDALILSALSLSGPSSPCRQGPVHTDHRRSQLVVHHRQRNGH